MSNIENVFKNNLTRPIKFLIIQYIIPSSIHLNWSLDQGHHLFKRKKFKFGYLKKIVTL